MQLLTYLLTKLLISNFSLCLSNDNLVVLLLSVLLLVSFMNMYSILHVFAISVTDC